MSEHGYNGYTNYATWAVSLWIDNDEGSQSYWLERAEQAIEAGAKHSNVPDIWTADEAARFELADALKAEHGEAAESALTGGASVFSDLLQSALADVNWHEIAAGLIETVRENA